MSRPPSFVPPACARRALLGTARGEFAVLDARPAAGAQVRGTALLLPGFTGSKEDFIALLEPVTEAGYRCVAVDGRGQYETPGPGDPAAYAQQELARDVLAQAAAVGEDGPVHLLGHSLGGQIARAAVLLEATPFRSLTLMSSGPGRISPSQRSRVELLSGALRTMGMREVWAAIQAMEPPEDTDTDHDAPDLQARWLRTDPAQLIATGAQLSGEPDRVEDLARVPLPKHVLSGERDETWAVPLMDEMAVRLGAHRTVVAGAEHSPNTDRPGATASALVEFWNGVERTH